MPTIYWRLFNGAAIVALTAAIGYDALGTNVFGSKPLTETMVDFHILREQSAYLVTHKRYDPDSLAHAYPPSAAVLWNAVTQFPLPVATAIWVTLTIGSALAIWWILARMLGIDRMPAGGALVFLAYASTCYFFQWDLRSQNCNLIFLAVLLCGLLCLHRQRPAAAGLWIALSFSLKLFSVFLIPYLLWSGRRRAFAWTLAFIAVFWLVVPAAVLGPDGCRNCYAEWLVRMRHVSNYPTHLEHPILISMQRAAAWLSAGDAATNWCIVNGIRIVWLATGLAAMWISRRRTDAGAYGLLTDVSVLVLAPVAVSPYLEPYHAVAFALPAVLLIRTAADVAEKMWLRLVTGLLLVTAGTVLWLPLEWEIRGLLVNAQLFLGVAGALLANSCGRHGVTGSQSGHDANPPGSVAQSLEQASAAA